MKYFQPGRSPSSDDWRVLAGAVEDLEQQDAQILSKLSSVETGQAVGNAKIENLTDQTRAIWDEIKGMSRRQEDLIEVSARACAHVETLSRVLTTAPATLQAHSDRLEQLHPMVIDHEERISALEKTSGSTAYRKRQFKAVVDFLKDNWVVVTLVVGIIAAGVTKGLWIWYGS